MRRNASSQWPYSVASVRRNLRRAGVLKNSSFTVTVVPLASAAGCGMPTSPASTSMRHACALSREREVSETRDTDAMLASASPRNPSVAIAFEIARRRELRRCVTGDRELQILALDAAAVVGDANSLTPPRASAMSISDAPASMLFSSSSFNAAAGRSTTSPAAIWLIS